MKKILIIALVLTSLTTKAQDNKAAKRSANEKLEAARIALITERLSLTPEQAQAFWPVYNAYAEERRQVQRQFREQQRGLDIENLTETQQKQLLRQRMEQKQKQLNLENKYSEKLLEVINVKQMMALKKAEDDFRTMIIRRIEQRQRQQLQQQMMLQQRERKLRQGNN